MTNNLAIVTTIKPEVGIVKNELTGQVEIEGFHQLFVKTCNETRTRRFHWKRAYSNIETMNESKHASKFTVITCTPPFSATRIVVKIKRVPDNSEDKDGDFRLYFYECYFNDKLCKGQHPNVVRVLNMWAHEPFREIYIEFEHGGLNLERFILDRSNDVNATTAKRIIKHALSALAYCHSHQVIHSDVSEKNFVINDRQEVKLCDFDMAQETGPSGIIEYNNHTSDVRRRAPELVMQLPFMGYGVDIFAMACVIIMMMGRDNELFETRECMSQLIHIQTFAGPIPKEMAEQARNTRIEWAVMSRVQIKNVTTVFTNLPRDPLLHDLLARMFDVNQHTRISAAMALQHPYFMHNV